MLSKPCTLAPELTVPSESQQGPPNVMCQPEHHNLPHTTQLTHVQPQLLLQLYLAFADAVTAGISSLALPSALCPSSFAGTSLVHVLFFFSHLSCSQHFFPKQLH